MTTESSLQKQGLYTHFDIGVLLSRWRTRVTINNIQKGPLVDIACGDNRLVRKLGFGTGVDIKNYGNVDVVVPHFKSLPFNSSSVEVVTILAALNYFDDPVDVLKEIKRILKPDGKLLVTFLNQKLSSLWHLVRDRSTPRPAYSAKQLDELTKAAGLKITKTERFMLGVNTLYTIKRSEE